MKEIQTHSIIRNSLPLEYSDGWYYKPSDVGMDGSGKSRFMIQRPFDILYYWKNDLLAIEAKLLKDGKRFDFNTVKEHQLNNLLQVDKNGGYSYIAIHLWRASKFSKIFFIEINDFLHWKEESESNVTWEEMETNYHVCLIKSVIHNLINLRKSFLIGG